MFDKKTLRGSFLLFLTAFIWGVAFVAQSKGSESMAAFTFNGTRSLLGALVLLPLIAFFAYRNQKTKTKQNGSARMNLLGGVCCGLILAVASTLQQFGIERTLVGKAGFITALYIIFVPVAGIFLKKKVRGTVWAGVAIATAGMYLLCVTEESAVNSGDVMLFIGALLFTVHILVIDYFSPKTDGVIVSCIQFFVCGLICIPLAFLFENPSVGQILDGGSAILYAGIMSCGVAYTLQIVGQKDMNPTVAALILSLESVVSAVMGYAAYRIGFLKTNQTLTGRQIAGCVIVFSAVILVQIPGKEIRSKNRGVKKGASHHNLSNEKE